MPEKPVVSRRDQIAMAMYAKKAEQATVQGREPGKGPTLVCIDFDYLGDKLGPERDLVCFVSLALFPHKFTTVNDLAHHYLGELRATRPDGPYHLCGYCFGAAVAVDLANLLIDAGERIGSLVLVEPPYPGATALQIGLRAAGRLLHLAVRPAEIIGYVRRRKKRRPAQPDQGAPVPGAVGPVEGFDRILRVMDDAVAHHAFRSYPGRVTILLGKQSPKRFVGALGWRAIAGGGVDVHLIRGDHWGIFNEDLVSFYRERLDQ
jgi:thioesterase domain-containing protein